MSDALTEREIAEVLRAVPRLHHPECPKSGDGHRDYLGDGGWCHPSPDYPAMARAVVERLR